MMIPIGLFARYANRSKLIMVIPRQQIHFTRNSDSWLFYRHQDHRVLMTIINKTLRPKLHHIKHQHIDISDEKNTKRLSFRQHEVIHYVIKGMSLNEISNILHIHEKTVSHHKRAAMRKLKLKGTTDLYHWALGYIAAPLFEE